MKLLKDVKPGDIIWAVNYQTLSPVILAWPIITIETSNGKMNNYWKFKIIMENGEYRTIHITEYINPEEPNDYDKPFSYVFELEGPNEEEIVDCYMLAFDRDAVYEGYVNKLKKSIQKIEESIKENHHKLVNYKTKLKALTLQGGQL